METPPREMRNRSRQILDAVVERLIASRWRDELFGNLCESSAFLAPGRYFLRAADLVSFAIVSEVRLALRTSTMFEPNRLGLLITVLGGFAGVNLTPAPSPIRANEFSFLDFFAGMIFGLAIVFWGLLAPKRSLWISALLVLLLAFQTCLAILNAVPGYVPTQSLGQWAVSITLLAISAGVVQRWVLVAE